MSWFRQPSTQAAQTVAPPSYSLLQDPFAHFYRIISPSDSELPPLPTVPSFTVTGNMTVFPSPWVMSVSFTGAAVLAVVVRRRWSNSALNNPPRPAANEELEAARHDTLSPMLRMCSDLYERGTKLNTRHPNVDDWIFIRGRNDGTLALWRRVTDDTPTNEYVVVVAGTIYPSHLWQDALLALDSSTASSHRWPPFAFRVEKGIKRLLTPDRDNPGSERNVSANSTIYLVGHSLAASVVEFLLHLFNGRHRTLRDTNPTIPALPAGSRFFGVTFDSPGLPHSLREEYGMETPLPNLTTLNARPNLVNTLNPPVATQFYTCDGGSVTLDWLQNTVWSGITLFTMAPKYLFNYCLFSTGRNVVLDTHPLHDIQRHLDNGNFGEKDLEDWTTITGALTRFISHPFGGAEEHAAARPAVNVPLPLAPNAPPPVPGRFDGLDAGVAGVFGGAAWAPGMAWWAGVGAAGTKIVTLPLVGVVATGPVMAATGATGAFYGVRRAYRWWRAPRRA